MRSRGPSLSGALLTLCLTLLVVGTGCWHANRLAPPDLTEPQAIVSRELERQRAVLVIMRRDLLQLEMLSSQLLDYPASAYAPPFPLQTFTLTLVSCFNEPLVTPEQLIAVEGGEQGARDEVISPVLTSARRFGVTCLPAALPVLERKLDALVATRHSRATELYALSRAQLARVEAVRVLRHRLHTRQTSLRLIRREAEELLETQRETWRRLAIGVDSRKLDYTPASFTRARDTLRAQKELIDELDAAIKALEQASQSWPDDMARVLNSLVYGLAWVGRV